MQSSRNIAPLVFAALSGFAAVFSAPFVRAAKPESVEDLIKRGQELRLQTKPAEALEVFERAHAVAPSTRTLVNIGLAEAALDRWVEAFDHLTAAVASAPDDYEWPRYTRNAVEATLKFCKRHIGEIAVTGPAGVEVFAAGKRVGALPLAKPIRMAAGDVVVRAVSPDYEPFATTIAVIAGGRTALTLALTSAQVAAPPPPPGPVIAPLRRPSPAPPALPPPSPPPTPDAGRTWKTPAGAAVGVAGVGLLAWGIVWIAIDGNTYGTSCATCRPRVRTTKTAGWILAGTGAAAMLGGGFLLYSDGGGTKVALGATTSGLLLAGAF